MRNNLFKKVISLVIALMMIMPALSANTAYGIPAGSTLDPGEVALTKEARWVDYDNRIAEVKFTVKGEPVKTAVDVVLVMDRSGSMGFGKDSRYSPCTNPDHWNGNVHRNGRTSWNDSSYNKTYGCTDRLDDAKNAANVFLDNLLENNIVDEFGNKNRVALVSFNNSVSTGSSNDFTETKSTLVTKIGGLTASNGTNYTDALNKAREYIRARNVAAGNAATVNSKPTFIIMLSDGKPDPTTSHGKNIADDLKTFTGEPLTIFTLGLDMRNNDDEVLKYIATNGGADNYYINVTNTGVHLQPVLGRIASMLKPAGTNASLADVISQYFDYYEDDDLKPNQTIVQSGKNISWTIGTITKDEIVLTFYLQLLEEFNISGTYPTNAGASLTYTPIEDNPGSKTADSPKLSVTTGSITVYYLLVDEDSGQYITEGGSLTDDIAHAQRVGKDEYTNLELTSHTIDADVPSGYFLYGEVGSVDVTLTDSETDKIVYFKVYEEETPVETYGYTIYYYIYDTDDLVPGISPNPVTGEGLAGDVITIAHPIVSGYKVMADQPESLTITSEGAVVVVYYEADEDIPEPEEVSYTVQYLDKETGEPVDPEKAPEKTGYGYPGDEVTEYAVDVDGYTPDLEEITFDVEEGLVITFWYTKDEPQDPDYDYIYVTKVWSSNSPKIKPTIKIRLFDGDEEIDSVELKNGKTTHVFMVKIEAADEPDEPGDDPVVHFSMDNCGRP